MAKSYQRNVLINTNKMEEQALLPFFAACLIILGCLCYFTYLLFFHPVLSGQEPFELLQYAYEIHAIKNTFLNLLLIVGITLFFLIYWAHQISNKILGPYERILADLDVIVSDRSQKKLRTRMEDDMFRELAQRINILIEQRQQFEKYPFNQN